MLARALPRLVAQISEKRRQPRFGCRLSLVDEANRHFHVENVGLRSMKFAGPPCERLEPHLLRLVLPGVDAAVELLAHPVWARRHAGGYCEYGARVEAEPADLRRFDFLYHSLAQGQEPVALCWRAFDLLDDLDDAHRLLGDVRGRPLLPEIASAVERLAAVSSRSPFLWRWAEEVLDRTTFSSVDPALRRDCIRTKLLATVLFTTVDDVADDVRDRRMLHRIVAQVASGGREGVAELDAERERVLGEFAALWERVREGAQRLPRFDDFDELFSFDALTIVHSMTHSLLARPGPDAIGDEEVRFWNVQAAYMMAFADLDLMCSPGFDLSELGAVRQLALAAQEMCAIANWLGTWEREVRSRDFSSGWVGVAVRRGIVPASIVDGLGGADELDDLIARLRRSDLEPCLLARWETLWRAVVLRRDTVRSIDVERYLASLEDFLRMQLAARGHL